MVNLTLVSPTDNMNIQIHVNLDIPAKWEKKKDEKLFLVSNFPSISPTEQLCPCLFVCLFVCLTGISVFKLLIGFCL